MTPLQVAIYWIEHQGARYHLPEGELLVGRGEVCAFILDDPIVSRRHAVIRRVGDRVFVVDLGSSNGSYVNAQRVEGERELQVGDVLSMGKAMLRLGTSEPAPAVTIAPGIEIIEQLPSVTRVPQPSVTTEPAVSSIGVLEALVGSPMASTDPLHVGELVQRSVSRLLDSHAERGVRLDADAAARLSSVAQLVGSWFADGAFDDWVRQVEQRIAELA